MNLSSIDLNLLVVFEALMKHRNVTRAGQQIGLSQPATSNALGRLRKLLADDLFIRTAGELQPTPRAIALALHIQPALSQIQTALTPAATFDPTTSDITFRIGMTDYVEFVLLPVLLKHVQTVAPKVSFQIRSGDRQQQLAMLDQGDLDLVCGLFPEKIDWHRQQRLLEEQFVGVCRQGHPHIKGELSLESYVAAQHLLVSVKEDRTGRIDSLLKKRKMRRHVAVSVPHFLVAPSLVSQTDLVTTMATRVAHAFTQAYALQILPLPFDVKGFGVSMRWHKSNEAIPAQKWLRARVEAVSANEVLILRESSSTLA